MSDVWTRMAIQLYPERREPVKRRAAGQTGDSVCSRTVDLSHPAFDAPRSWVPSHRGRRGVGRSGRSPSGWSPEIESVTVCPPRESGVARQGSKPDRLLEHLVGRVCTRTMPGGSWSPPAPLVSVPAPVLHHDRARDVGRVVRCEEADGRSDLVRSPKTPHGYWAQRTSDRRRVATTITVHRCLDDTRCHSDHSCTVGAEFVRERTSEHE
jgi:hypothetical protein